MRGPRHAGPVLALGGGGGVHPGAATVLSVLALRPRSVLAFSPCPVLALRPCPVLAFGPRSVLAFGPRSVLTFSSRSVHALGQLLLPGDAVLPLGAGSGRVDGPSVLGIGLAVGCILTRRLKI